MGACWTPAARRGAGEVAALRGLHLAVEACSPRSSSGSTRRKPRRNVPLQTGLVVEIRLDRPRRRGRRASACAASLPGSRVKARSAELLGAEFVEGVARARPPACALRGAGHGDDTSLSAMLPPDEVVKKGSVSERPDAGGMKNGSGSISRLHQSMNLSSVLRAPVICSAWRPCADVKAR